jgi:hypothetical protein
MRRTTVIAIALLLLAGCGDDDSGRGDIGPQGDIGPGELEIDDGDGVAGSGTIVAETRSIESIDSITLIGEGDVVITRDTATSLVVETDDNLLPLLETTVADATLRISTAVGTDIDPSSPPVYRIATPDLVEVELLGAGSITTGGWDTGRFIISMRGVGDITVEDLTADELSVDLAGVGSVTITGDVSHQRLTMAGLTEYHGGDLSSESTTVTCVDAGTAEISATDSLEVDLTGVCAVTYRGDPGVEITRGDPDSVIPLGNG